MGRSEGRGEGEEEKREGRREEEGGYMCKVMLHKSFKSTTIPFSPLMRIKSPVRSHTPITHILPSSHK